jgi:hypothetical protein
MKPARLLARLAVTAVLLSPSLAAAQAADPAKPSHDGAASGPKPRSPSEPSAAASEEGKNHFLRGVSLFHEGDFRSALVEFRRAYELSHNFKVLYNLGQTELELQDYAAARGSFQRYLAEGGGEIDAARRATVDEEIKKLAARVARVEIKANVADAEVLVDDVVVGKTPLKEPVLVSIGRRKITLQKGGAVSAARFVELAGGDLAPVEIELADGRPAAVAPIAPVVPAVVPLPAPVAPAPPSRTGMWASLGVTGALTLGAVVTGVLALGAHSTAETELGMLGGVTAPEISAAHSKTANLALVTDILGGTAIAMAAVTIALGVTGSKSADAPPRAALTVGPRGAFLSVGF